MKKIESEKIETILAKKDFSPIIKNFLTRALEFDKNHRMSPQELLTFNFSCMVNQDETVHGNLSEKKLNMTFKYETLASEISTPQRSKDKTRLTSEKSEKKILNPLKNVNIQLQPTPPNQNYSTGGFKKSENEENKNQSLPFSKDQKEVTKNNTSVGGGLKKEEKKNVSKILIAEVHFCRFLYKLLMRIKESTESGILHNFEESSEVKNIFSTYTKLIKYKLQKIINFSTNNFLKMR